MSTYVSSHTLDLVMTHTLESVVSDVYTDACISGDMAVHFKVKTTEQQVPQESRSTCSYKEIDKDCFHVDLWDSTLPGGSSCNLDSLVERYNCTLKRLVDTHAPVRSKVIAICKRVSWYAEAVREAKCKHRQL